jgi:poly-gamma-glutamate capsule biosynthesis protein CapA/YwtB (metallophosphatase superfamily)
MNALRFALFSLILCSPPGAIGEGSDSTVVLRFGGDLLLAGHYETSVRDSPALAFEGFDLFRTDDASVVNLECPITSRGTKVAKPYNFRMRPGYACALLEAGIDGVCIANNHIYDFGKEGLFDTISYLDSLGLFHVGAGRTRAEARKPVILCLKGLRIGFLGYYGGGEAPVAEGTEPGVAPRNLDVIAQDIRALRKDSVEYVVVMLHWGTEKAEYPDDGQQAFAHGVIDAGADAVIGHHPHVLQGIEQYRNGVIVYSLGNFVFGGVKRDSYDTALFEIRLSRHAAAYTLIPVGIRQWRVRELAGEEALRVSNHVETLSLIFPKSIFTTKEKP